MEIPIQEHGLIEIVVILCELTTPSPYPLAAVTFDQFVTVLNKEKKDIRLVFLAICRYKTFGAGCFVTEAESLFL